MTGELDIVKSDDSNVIGAMKSGLIDGPEGSRGLNIAGDKNCGRPRWTQMEQVLHEFITALPCKPVEDC